MQKDSQRVEVVLTEWVKLKLSDPSNFWTSRTVRTIVTPGLCAPVILGLPFLAHNKIVVDHDKRTAIAKDANFDLLHPVAPPPPSCTAKTKA